MTREEFAIIWEDWLRGVSIVALGGVTAGIYFLGVLSSPVYATLMATVFLAACLILVANTCVAGVCPLWTRLASVLVSLASGALFLLTVCQVHFPGPALGTAALSDVEQDAQLVVPEDAAGPLYLVVKGTPGASPGGTDEQVEAGVRLTAAGLDEQLKISLYHAKAGKSSGGRRGGSPSRKTSDAYLLDLPAGPVHLHLDSLRPVDAMPLAASLHQPRIAPGSLTVALAVLVLAACAVAYFVARRGQFPGVLPLCVTMLGLHLFARAGYSPTDPVFPLLGMLAAVSIPAAAVGWIPAWLLQRLTAGPQKATPTRKRGRT